MLTVKSDCPVQIFRKMMKYLKIYTDSSFTLLVLLFCLDILNKSYTCNKDGRSLKTSVASYFWCVFFFLSLEPFVWNRLNKTCFNTKRFNGI